MHVLPLPFGLALAVLPRRDAQQLRKPRAAAPLVLVGHGPSHRDRVLSDVRYAQCRRQLV